MLSGITNAAVTGLLGGSDMDITKAFIGGYLFGVAAGIGVVLLTTAVTNALLLARFYVITATAGAAMSVGAAIYAIMTNNKKAAIVYGVLAVLSIFNMAEAYNYYCQVWLIGEKGIAAFSTADFSTAKGMSESSSNTGKLFKNQSLLEEHYEKHGQEIAKVLGESNYSVDKYLDDANYIINNGTYAPELNSYVSFMSGKKYGFVGLDRTTGDITTFHIKNVYELINKAPSLGFER